MNRLTKLTAVAAAGLAVTMLLPTPEAEARSRRAGAVAAGVIIGSVIAGAAASRAYGYDRRVYVTRGPSCGEYRRQARYFESIGRWRSAERAWYNYDRCRHGY